MHKTESAPENKTEKNYLGFRDKNRSLNIDQNTRPTVYQPQKRTWPLADFAIPANVSKSENEKLDE